MRNRIHRTETRVGALTTVLTDSRFDRETNLLRLQGWRGDELTASVDTATFGHRLGPATCGILALSVAITGSMVLLFVTLATAAVGIVARNHPAETAYNTFVRRIGGQPLPRNRAAKRLACALGSAFLAGAGIAFVVGQTAIATLLLVSLGTLALFVASTGICVPSMIFTLLFGVERGMAPRLISRRPRLDVRPA